MSSSSSDSDSDSDCEPVRKIRISIRPKEEAIKPSGADVNEIKASVEAWRPLGPPVHPSLSRRQSSLSSMTSLSFGSGSTQAFSTCNNLSSNKNAGIQNNGYNRHHVPMSRNRNNIYGYGNSNTMRSSPSCSSLVNEFYNRSTFSNFMPQCSRTSSPLTLMGQSFSSNSNLSDPSSVPIAIAIQESIELTVKGGRQTKQVKPTDTKFETRALGNIKVAFPQSFARLGGAISSSLSLKLRIHSTENILRYYASPLIGDLDSETSSLAESSAVSESRGTYSSDTCSGNSTDKIAVSIVEEADRFLSDDMLDMTESPTRLPANRTKVIEFDMNALMVQLTQMYNQTPDSRYYSVDVLRYQITPIERFDQSPLQVCAYWKIEPKFIKLRIDFKHSSTCGFNLERLREISFAVDFNNLVPEGLVVNSSSSETMSTSRKSNNNNNNTTNNNNNGTNFHSQLNPITAMTQPISPESFKSHQSSGTIVWPSSSASTSSSSSNIETMSMKQSCTLSRPKPRPRHSLEASSNSSLFDIIDDKPKQNQPKDSSTIQIKLPPPPSTGHSRAHHHNPKAASLASKKSQVDELNALFAGVATVRAQPAIATNQPVVTEATGSNYAALSQLFPAPSNPTASLENNQLPSQFADLLTGDTTSISSKHQSASSSTTNTPPSLSKASQIHQQQPHINFEPAHATWNSTTKQLIWKFDNLLPYYKTDGYGSLLAKLDFRDYSSDIFGVNQSPVAEQTQPNPIEVKFMVVDSTLSKISMSIDSNGYRMCLLKKEIRSGRYKSEPYVF